MAHNAEQVLNFLVVQRRGGLVQNQQLGVGVQRLRDLQQLLLAGLQLAYHGIGVDVHAQLLEQLVGLGDHALLVKRAGLGQQLLAKKDVFIDLEIVEKIQLLMNEGDARLLGGLNRDVIHFLTVKDDLSGIAGIDAGQDVHQGGFARAVFAQKRMHLALAHRKIHLVQHGHPKECLRDP